MNLNYWYRLMINSNTIRELPVLSANQSSEPIDIRQFVMVHF